MDDKTIADEVTQALEALLARKADEAAASEIPPPAERKRLRLLAGIDLSEAARLLGVSYFTVLRWEGGKTVPQGDHRIRYVAFINRLRAHAVRPLQSPGYGN